MLNNVPAVCVDVELHDVEYSMNSMLHVAACHAHTCQTKLNQAVVQPAAFDTTSPVNPAIVGVSGGQLVRSPAVMGQGMQPRVRIQQQV